MPKRRLTEEEELAQALKESQKNSQEEEEGEESDAKRRSGGGGASDEGEEDEESLSSESESDDSELDPFAAATDAPPTVGGRAVGTSPADANGLLQVGASPAAGGARSTEPLSAAALAAAEKAEAVMTAAYIAQLQREDADEHDKATQDAIRKLQADENRQAAQISAHQGGGAGRWGGGGIPGGGGCNSPVANSLAGPSAAGAQADVSREFERGREYQEYNEYGHPEVRSREEYCEQEGERLVLTLVEQQSLHAVAAEPVAPDIQVATSHAADEEMDLYINEGGEEVR